MAYTTFISSTKIENPRDRPDKETAMAINLIVQLLEKNIQTVDANLLSHPTSHARVHMLDFHDMVARFRKQLPDIFNAKLKKLHEVNCNGNEVVILVSRLAVYSQINHAGPPVEAVMVKLQLIEKAENEHVSIFIVVDARKVSDVVSK